MAKWIDIGEEKEFAAGTKKCLNAGGIPVVVAHVEGEGLLACANVCPHAGLPLGQGDLEGLVLTCPFHGYAYNIKTGKNVDFEGDVPLIKFPTRSANGRIEVELPVREEPAAAADAKPAQ